MKQIVLNKWNRGIVNDPRAPYEAVSQVLTNFDVHTNPYQLMPRFAAERGDDDPTNRVIKNYAVGKHGGLYRLYGLGLNASNYAKVYYKNLTTTGNTDLTDDQWASNISDNESSSGSVNFNLFVWYERQTALYGARSTRYIWKYEPNQTWTDTDLDLGASVSRISQGLVHSKDDILYIPYDNKIAKKNGNNAWDATAITIPEEYYISSICEYGNYIAIGATPVQGSAGSVGLGNSRVYLWDRDASLTTLSENISFGEGRLKILGEIDGHLIGISESSIYARKKVIFRDYTGGPSAKKVLEMEGDANSAIVLENVSQKVNNRLVFGMGLDIDSASRVGLWSVSLVEGRLVLVHENTCKNDDAVNSNGAVTGFIDIGGYTFISYLDSAGNNAVSKTKSPYYYYDSTATWISMVNPRMEVGDRGKQKQLMGIRVIYKDAYDSDNYVSLKVYYRADGESWTEIFTDTDDISGTEVIRTREEERDVNKSNFKSGREYEFKIESNGFIPFELAYNYEIIETQV